MDVSFDHLAVAGVVVDRVQVASRVGSPAKRSTINSGSDQPASAGMATYIPVTASNNCPSAGTLANGVKKK